MKTEAQIRALAKLDGWKKDERGWIRPDGHREEFNRQTDISYEVVQGIPPDYRYYYDNIIPLIQKQPPEIKWKFIGHLASMLKPGQYNWDATTEQLCEALLRAHELWEE